MMKAERNTKKDSPERRAVFLENMANGYSPSRSAIAVGISPTQAWNWRSRDSKFAAQWDEALRCGTEKLEDEAYRRAHDGCTKPVYQGGVQVGNVQEYSDTLLIFLLKGRKPDVYRDNHEVNVKGNIEHTFSLKIFGGDEGGKVIDVTPESDGDES